jgi:hypothetical protein
MMMQRGALLETRIISISRDRKIAK